MPGALAGIRVVELTTAWAGPMAGRVLAFLGAEVIHVEAATRVDSWRSHREGRNPRNFPGQEAGERPYNRSFLFNSQNVNKLSITLDVKKPGGAETLLDLVTRADVLVCNFRPGTLRKVGLDYASLRKRRPGIIVAEMPAFGSSGPLSGHAALGPTMEMAAGMSGLIGYPGAGPEVTGLSYLDPIGAYHGAAAILTALFHRQRTGEGQYVEVPQVEAAMHYIGEYLLEAAETGTDPDRRGNHVDWAAPHDAFPALGTDEWVAISVADEGAWAALCRVLGTPGLADDPRFATLAVRLENEDALYDAIAPWTRQRSKHDAARQLQAAGIAAAPVNNPRDVVECDYLATRGYFTDLTHPEAGRHAHPGLPIHLSRDAGQQRRAAPCFGQDQHHILHDMLGRSSSQVAKLDAAGVLDKTPLA